MNQHRLIIDRGVIEKDFAKHTTHTVSEYRDTSSVLKYQLFYQMSHITAERGSLAHDDRLDALAMLVAYFTKEMGRDVDKSILMRKDKELRAELDVFMSQGMRPSKWFDRAVAVGVTSISKPAWRHMARSGIRR